MGSTEDVPFSEWAFEKCAHGVGAVNAATILFSCCDAFCLEFKLFS